MGLFKNLLGTTLDEFRIGRNRSGNKSLVANTDATNKPALRYNDTSKLWEVSHDGTDFNDIGTLGYADPENVPYLEYVSASQIHLHAPPGAGSLLRAMLNDGEVYTVSAPLTIDLTVSGRGGLDSGTEASSTWYYAYLVPNSAGDALSALCSINGPSTGPTGYDVWRYVGAFRNDGSSNIIKFHQVSANRFFYDSVIAPSELSLSTLGTSEVSSPTAKSLSDVIPVNKGAVFLEHWASSSNASSALVQSIYVAGNTSAEFSTIVILVVDRAYVSCELPIDGTVGLNYKCTGNIEYQEVVCQGWMDGYLLEKSSQVQSKYSPDTALPRLAYSSASAINVAAAPGQNSTVLLTLQDGKQRSFTGTLAWSFSNGAADLGLDEGSEASSTWYYMYAVPKSGADDFLTVRASDNAPSSGPTGYANWKYLGSFRNDGSSDIIPFFQVGTSYFKRASYVSIDLGTTPDSDPVQYNIDTYVPKSAEAVEMSGYVQAGNGAYMIFDVWVTGYQTGTPTYRSNAPGSWTGEINTAFVPTPGTTKEIYYKRHGSGDLNGSLIEFNGWLDGYLSSPQSAGAGAPGKHAAAHQNGGSDEISTATPAANAIPKANGSGKLDSWITSDAAAGTASLRTLGTSSTSACAGNDSRLSDSRTPTSHATTHKHNGGDEVGTATPAANAIPKADGSGTLNSWVTTYLISPTTLANLDDVPTTGLSSGTQIYVTDVDGVYEFESSGSYTADGLGVIAGKDGGYWIGEVVGRWDDVLGDVAQGQAAAALTYEVYRDTAYLIYCMRHDQDDTLHFRFQFPHRWKYDTDVVLHLHYLPLADPASDQNVHFDGYYAWSKIGGTAVPALTGWTTFSVTQTISNGDVYKQKIKTLATITPPSEARESTFLLVYLRRNSGASDTYTTSKDHGTAAANVGLLGVDIHFRVNKLGTITELPS